ncbi:hypothetical protein BD309DRAFT_485069 [Dichomitus squalens]|nr:hypothetical protein BD309DRAFT_485069 [Dichomitus squalens]
MCKFSSPPRCRQDIPQVLARAPLQSLAAATRYRPVGRRLPARSSLLRSCFLRHACGPDVDLPPTTCHNIWGASKGAQSLLSLRPSPGGVVAPSRPVVHRPTNPSLTHSRSLGEKPRMESLKASYRTLSRPPVPAQDRQEDVQCIACTTCDNNNSTGSLGLALIVRNAEATSVRDLPPKGLNPMQLGQR